MTKKNQAKASPKTKKAAKAKPKATKKADEAPKIRSANPYGGFLGMAIRHYAKKGHPDPEKKAHEHYTRHAARLADATGEKDGTLVRRMMDHYTGRQLWSDAKRGIGKVSTWAHHAKIRARNFKKVYDPLHPGWGVGVNEGTEMSTKGVEQTEENPDLNPIIDTEFTDEEAERIITEEQRLMQEAQAFLLDSIIEDKPHDALSTLDAIMKTKLEGMIASYKQYLAEKMFGGEDDEDDEDEDDVPAAPKDDDTDDDEDDENVVVYEDDDGNEYELDLDDLSDDELAEIFDELEGNEDPNGDRMSNEGGLVPDDEDEVTEEGALQRFRDATRDKDKWPAIRAGVKAAVKGKDKKPDSKMKKCD